MSTPDADLLAILPKQRLELMAAEAVESDLELAFNLQMQEAINASLSSLPSSSSSPPSPPPQPPSKNDDVFNFASMQYSELDKFEQEAKDRQFSIAEFRRAQDDLLRRIHDQKVAAEIMGIPDDEWDNYGDNYEKPFGEGSSRSDDNGEVFKVYFKGLVSDEWVEDREISLSGIGVAVCDSSDNVILEMRKPLMRTTRKLAELTALIEGLNAAITLGLKLVRFFVDYYPLHQYVTRRWTPKQPKIATLVNEVFILQKKFDCCDSALVARNDIKYAFKLAREAVLSQITRPVEISGGKVLRETCVICLEDVEAVQMFSVDGCRHQFCFSCMKQHVEVKLLHGMLPKCPHEGCKSELSIKNCGKFLTPKLSETMSQRIKEASIPVTEKVYCPYPRCSALMSKGEIRAYPGGTIHPNARKCRKCGGLFCINCKVRWHHNITCSQYMRSNPCPNQEDAKLKSLASRNFWRQCVKCNHMIELAEGCYHMTCRCGYEFCYTCGAEWKNKRATCSCPLWDEENIVYDEDDDYYTDEEEEEEEDEGIIRAHYNLNEGEQGGGFNRAHYVYGFYH